MQSEGSMDLNDKKQKIIPQIWHGIWEINCEIIKIQWTHFVLSRRDQVKL